MKPALRDCETFSRNAIGVRAIHGSPASAPTPLALGLNVETFHSWPGGESQMGRTQAVGGDSTGGRARAASVPAMASTARALVKVTDIVLTG